MQALAIYRKENPEAPTIPRRGTEAHKEVKAIQEKLKAGAKGMKTPGKAGSPDLPGAPKKQKKKRSKKKKMEAGAMDENMEDYD
jgi:hypothetical protein